MNYSAFLLPNNLLGIRLVLILVSFITDDRNLLIPRQLLLTPLRDRVDVQHAEVHVEELEKSHNLIAGGASNDSALQTPTSLYSEIAWR